jgi:hypothetical protein
MFGLGLVAAIVGVAVARTPVAVGLALIGGALAFMATADGHLLPLTPEGDTS